MFSYVQSKILNLQRQFTGLHVVFHLRGRERSLWIRTLLTTTAKTSCGLVYVQVYPLGVYLWSPQCTFLLKDCTTHAYNIWIYTQKGKESWSNLSSISLIFVFLIPLCHLLSQYVPTLTVHSMSKWPSWETPTLSISKDSLFLMGRGVYLEVKHEDGAPQWQWWGPLGCWNPSLYAVYIIFIIAVLNEK